jgi:hypothetical protein
MAVDEWRFTPQLKESHKFMTVPHCGYKTLPLRPEPRYNSHRPQASGSVRPVLPGGLVSAVVALFSAWPPDKSLLDSARIAGYAVAAMGFGTGADER